MAKNTVDKVLNVAANEVGYLEKSASAYKKDQSCLDEKTRGAGKDNYTKYGRDMHKVYPAVMDFPAAWCDAFVDWCFYKAYKKANAKKLIGGNFDDYTVASAQLYKNKGALGTTPKLGAQVFFTRNGQVGGCYHTGLVYSVDRTYFYTIEGNTSGASGVVSNGGGVTKKKYSISAYKGKTLFGYPKYDAGGSIKEEMPTIRKGSSGDAVRKWQKFLKSKNYDIGKYGADGDFGEDTYAATRKFQKAKKLEVDGVVGKNTWAAAGF